MWSGAIILDSGCFSLAWCVLTQICLHLNHDQHSEKTLCLKIDSLFPSFIHYVRRTGSSSKIEKNNRPRLHFSHRHSKHVSFTRSLAKMRTEPRYICTDPLCCSLNICLCSCSMNHFREPPDHTGHLLIRMFGFGFGGFKHLSFCFKPRGGSSAPKAELPK